MLADESGEVQVTRGERNTDLFVRFATGAGVRGFANVGVQLAAAWTPETAIRFLGALQQQHFILLVEAVEERGDFIRQGHARSEARLSLPRKPAG